MWSLPDIKSMNARAAKDAQRIKKIAATGRDGRKKVPCECKGWGRNDCSGKVIVYEWYDIFSDDPKGVFGLCEHHDGYFGSPTEGYFTCDACNRVFAENYTWEIYRVTDADSGETFCLNCYRERVLNDPDEWLEIAPALEMPDKNLFALAKASKHLLAVGQDCPKELQFVGNAEFDSMNGHQISGDSLRELLQEARSRYSAEKAILILDAAYQFAVSIGVYVRQHDAKPARAA